jgi:hypothetical protein
MEWDLGKWIHGESNPKTPKPSFGGRPTTECILFFLHSMYMVWDLGTKSLVPFLVLVMKHVKVKSFLDIWDVGRDIWDVWRDIGEFRHINSPAHQQPFISCHFSKRGAMMQELRDVALLMVRMEIARQVEIERVLDVVLENESILDYIDGAHDEHSQFEPYGALLVAPEFLQQFPPTTASPDELIQRALYRAGRLHRLIFIPHESTVWHGVALIYTDMLSDDSGFERVLIGDDRFVRLLAPIVAAFEEDYM